MRRTAICQVKVEMRWERRFGRFLVDDAGWVPRREKGGEVGGDCLDELVVEMMD